GGWAGPEGIVARHGKWNEDRHLGEQSRQRAVGVGGRRRRTPDAGCTAAEIWGERRRPAVSAPPGEDDVRDVLTPSPPARDRLAGCSARAAGHRVGRRGIECDSL